MSRQQTGHILELPIPWQRPTLLSFWSNATGDWSETETDNLLRNFALNYPDHEIDENGNLI